MAFSDFLMAALPALLSILVPGFVLALPLMKKMKLGVPEALGVGFALGLIIPPALLMIEAIVGIPYSYALFMINTLALTILGLVLCVKQGVFPLQLGFNPRKEWTWICLLLLMLLAFYIRMQSAFPTNAGSYFYEFDPYYYTRITQYIVQDGAVPAYDDLAWYPHLSSHRAPPLAYYLGAEWYSIYDSGKPFDLYTLGFVQSFYPPVVAAAAVFFAYLLIAVPYGRKLGLVSAGLFAFTPRIIEKLAAWEQEQTPWGVFGIFFFFAAYSLVIKRQDRASAMLAGIALAALTLGSKNDVQAYLVLAGYLGLQGTLDYLKGRQLSWKFLELNAIIVAFGVAAQLLMNVGYATPPSIPTDPFALIGALGYYYLLTVTTDTFRPGAAKSFSGLSLPQKILRLPAYALDAAVQQSGMVEQEGERRLAYLTIIVLLGVVVLVSTPLGPPVLGYVSSAASESMPRDPLSNTVAEEGGTGNEFTSALGPIGIPLKILFENNLLSGAAGQLVFLIPFIIALAIAWKYDSKYSLYFAIIVLPVVWVGLGKIKFVLQLATVMLVGFCAVLGGLALMLQQRAKDEKSKVLIGRAAFGLGAIVLLLTAWPAILATAASMNQSNYVDAGNGQMIIDCNKLSANVGSSLFELSSGDKARALQLSYYLYCSRIPQWWLDPMDWIRNNVPEDDRVIHWWDYGHWTNYFGQRKTITRNDHVYTSQDLEMADLLVFNTPEHAAQWMREHKAKYLLLDSDLIGKWGALVYLACVQNNETQFIPRQVGSSACEANHYFERVFVPLEPTDADLCSLNAPFQMFHAVSTHRPDGYCIGQTTQNGQQTLIVAYQNGTQVKAILSPEGQTTLGDGRQYVSFMAIYPPPGQGYEDRAGLAYDSIFYKGFFLGHIDGFEQVFPYQAEEGQFGPSLPVRIFKLKDEAPATSPVTQVPATLPPFEPSPINQTPAVIPASTPPESVPANQTPAANSS